MSQQHSREELENRIRQLEKEADFYRRMVESSTDMISRHDADGCFVYASHSCQSLLGYSADELVGKTPYDYFHPDDIESIRKSHSEILKAPIVYTVPYRFKHKDGHYLWVEATSKTVRNLGTGRVEGIIAITRDITERKQAEGSLFLRLDFERLISEISSEFLRLGSKTLDRGIEKALASIGALSKADRAYLFQYREDGRFVENTHEWCADGIASQKDRLKKIVIEKEMPWFHKNFRDRDFFAFNKLSELPPDAEIEHKRFRLQGIQSLIVVPMIFADQMIGFIGFEAIAKEQNWTNEHLSILRLFGEVFANAIERMRIEERLRSSEERWQFALEGAGDGVWDWNAGTNRVFFSPQWKAMLGYTDNEIGDSLDEWDSRVHPDDKDSVYADLNAHFRGDTAIYQNEHRVQCKDGSYKWILDRGKVIEWTVDHEPRRVIGTHADITDRKAYEKERERLIFQLKAALDEVKILSGMLPICSNCKKIRDDKGYWSQIETYIHEHTEAEFSHSICPDCAKKLYPDLDLP